MLLSNLEILHIYEYQKVSGARDFLESFRREANPIELSTCMRHIYLFNQLQKPAEMDSLTQLLHYLKTPQKYQLSPEHHYLQGEKAYSFLLYWVVGGLHPKKPFDDDRLLGQFRDIYTKYKVSNSPRLKEIYNKNQEIMDLFMIDAKRMHNALLTIKDRPLEEKKHLFKQACDNCSWARNNDFLEGISELDYTHFFDEETMKSYLSEKLTFIENKLATSLESIKLKKQCLNKNATVFSPKTNLIFHKIETNVEEIRGAKLRISRSADDISYLRQTNTRGL